MDTWHSLNLGDAIEAAQPLSKIKEAIMLLLFASGGTPDIIAFSRENPETNIMTAYFPPAASDVAIAFGATPCERPTRDGLIPIFGDQRAWEIYYPVVK